MNPDADRLSATVLHSLDEGGGTANLARRAYQSRTQLFRLFRALVEETPGAMRRRLLLERAAWQLAHTERSVTQIALDADYGSLEAFTRAFRRAFRVPPSLYRRMGTRYTHLPSPNGFHYGAAGSRSKGAMEMDLFDLFAGNDSWHTQRLFEYAGGLTDEQLDRPLSGIIGVVPWEKPERNLRELLNRMVTTREIWTAGLTGGELPAIDGHPPEAVTPMAMLARFKEADAKFQSILAGVRDRGGWEDTFVDALCEPPETFTFGGIFGHVITFNIYRRLTAIDCLRRLGVNVEGFGCPMEFEAAAGAKSG
jgi:AraC-like DNA-binding protein